MQNVVMLNVVAPLVVMSTGCWQLHEIVFYSKTVYLTEWRHNIQHNDIQHNNTQHNDV